MATHGWGESPHRDELVALWARLERLKVGIGGWIITGATMPPAEARAQNVDGRIRDLIDVAIDVKARITELSPPGAVGPPGPLPGPPRQQTDSPLSPATGLPVVEPIVEPGSETRPTLEQRLRDRIKRQRQHPAHREDDDRGWRSA